LLTRRGPIHSVAIMALNVIVGMELTMHVYVLSNASEVNVKCHLLVIKDSRWSWHQGCDGFVTSLA